MRPTRRYWLIAIALIMPLTFAGAHPGQRATSRRAESDASRQRIAEDFSKALLVAKDNYAGQVELDKLTKASIQGMLRSLDPHSAYFDRKEWEDFQNDQRSRYSGIGATIAARNGKVYIMSPFNGTPAHRAGIRFGDHISEVNGESTDGWTSRMVSDKLLGPEGTQVVVKVGRAGIEEPVVFKIIRGSVPLPSIANFYMVRDGIGYVNLQRGFNTTTAEEMRRAIEELRSQGMRSLILDLRANRGGLVDQAFKVSNMFLYKGQKIVSMRGRASSFPSRDLVALNNSPEDFPVVVLINRGSASASEIVAGALQDHDRARIVGEQSFGKGLVQSVFPIRDGSGLTLTTGHFYTPSGRLIQRDYSNRSFYDYYLQRGDKEAVQRKDERRTDSGRAVYGGGGIDPDVVVKYPAKEGELQRYWLEPVFQFARVLVAGSVSGLGQFKIDRAANHSHRLSSDEFIITDKVLAAFKDFLSQNKEYKVDVARIDKDADWLKRQIRYEVVTAAYGQEVAYQVLLEGDIQMQRSISEIPNAQAMLIDFMRERTGSRRGELRNN